MATTRGVKTEHAQSGDSVNGTSSTNKTANATSSATGAKTGTVAETTTGQGKSTRGPIIRLPWLGIEFRRPELPFPSPEAAGAVMKVVRERMPGPASLAYCGALGALVVLSVIELPVAAAIGVGVLVAQRSGRGEPATGNPSRPGSAR